MLSASRLSEFAKAEKSGLQMPSIEISHCRGSLQGPPFLGMMESISLSDYPSRFVSGEILWVS